MIALTGKTYPHRKAIRKLFGPQTTWNKQEEIWTLPNTPENVEKIKTLRSRKIFWKPNIVRPV